MSIPPDIQKDLDGHKNELVIMCDLSIGKLLDVKDGDEDYYWKIQKTHDKIEYYSCVMGFIALKGQLSESDYGRINHVFKLNTGEDG